MDKNKQRSLNKWLKQQSKLAKRWLMAAVGLGILSSLFLLAQAALLATILQQLIIDQVPKQQLIPLFFALCGVIGVRALCSWGRELAGYRCGEQVRLYIRQLILDKLRELGPAYIRKTCRSMGNPVLEQVEDMHDFFARYLPQISLAVIVPIVILIVVFPVNWVAGLIFDHSATGAIIYGSSRYEGRRCKPQKL